MKKKIIGNTIIFVTIILFINIFTSLFGSINSVVGVTVITAALMLLQKDLTANPFQNLMFLVGINIFTGIFAHLASLNLWIGIPLNFIALFVIAYTCSSAIKTSVVVAFGLQYLFMLFTPVSGNEFLNRILGLIFGAVFIMVLQFIANRNKLEKIFPKIFISILEDIVYNLENKEIKYNEINLKIQNLKKVVYESRKKSFYISNIGKKVVDTLYILEKINIDLSENQTACEDEKNEIISDLKSLIQAVQEGEVYSLSNKTKNKNILSRDINQLVYILEELAKDLKEKKNAYSYEFEISNKFNLIKILKDNFKLSSLRVSYGLRLAIVGMLSIFIVQIFNFKEGKWLVYTIFSLIQPYSENSMVRIKERISGTIIGVIIVVVAFVIFKNTAIRGVIILGAGYLNTFVKNYQKLIILVTISAVASIALERGMIFNLAMTRLIFVVLGGVLAYIGSKYLFPYKINDGNAEIKMSYDKLTAVLSEEIQNKTHEDEVKSLYLLSAYLEEKLSIINESNNLKIELDEYIDLKRREVNKIYRSYHNLNSSYLAKNGVSSSCLT